MVELLLYLVYCYLVGPCLHFCLWCYLISLLGLGLVAFAYFDGTIVITCKIWLGLLGVIMIGWGFPFNNRKGHRAMTIFWSIMAIVVGIAAIAFIFAYGVINRH